MGVRHSTKFVLCLGGSVKDINTAWWIRLCVAAATNSDVHDLNKCVGATAQVPTIYPPAKK